MCPNITRLRLMNTMAAEKSQISIWFVNTTSCFAGQLKKPDQPAKICLCEVIIELQELQKQICLLLSVSKNILTNTVLVYFRSFTLV